MALLLVILRCKANYQFLNGNKIYLMSTIKISPDFFHFTDVISRKSNDCLATSIEIRSIQWLQHNRKQQQETPHSCRQFMVVWIRNGRGAHRIDMSRYDVHDMLYCITPGHMHQIMFTDEMEGYIIYFTAEGVAGISSADLLFNTHIFYSHPVNLLENITSENRKDIEDIFCRLAREFDQYSQLRSEMLSSFMKILLTYLAYHSAPNTNVLSQIKRTDLVKKFFTLLESNYKCKKQVTDYASDLAITPTYLNELIKKATGMPASYHIRQRIVLEAKRQATYNGLNMKETAYFLGFEDLAHFSKFFKNATGTNFTNFKKQFTKFLPLTSYSFK